MQRLEIKAVVINLLVMADPPRYSWRLDQVYCTAHSTWPVWSRGGVHGGAQDADRALTRGRCMRPATAHERRSCATAGKEEDHHGIHEKEIHGRPGEKEDPYPFPIRLVGALIARVTIYENSGTHDELQVAVLCLGFASS